MVIETAVEGTCVFRLSGPVGHEGIPKVLAGRAREPISANGSIDSSSGSMIGT